MKLNKNKKIAIAAVATAIVIILAVLYFNDWYPSLMVGKKFISSDHVEQNLETAKKLDPATNGQQALEQLIKNYKLGQLVSDQNIKYNSETIDDELNFLIMDKDGAYQELLNQYFGGDEKKFNELVLLPNVYDALLRIKYNSNFGANNQAYAKAQNISSQLNQGKSFEDLAKTESDDKISGPLGGDLGFLRKNQILPELWTLIQNSNLGEVNKQIFISREGYHILYPIETADQNGEKTWHIKHILIETDGFESWLDLQLDKIRVWRILG